MKSLFSSNNFPSDIPNVPRIPYNPSNPVDSGIPEVPNNLPNNIIDFPELPTETSFETPSETPSKTLINNPTTDYLNQIQIIQEKLPSLLDDFKKYYVFYSKNPTFNEYQSIFDNLQLNLKDIENQLIKISNSTDIHIFEVANKLLEINKLIEKEKSLNKKLKSEESQNSNKYNGSKELISNYKEIYNRQYLMNIFQ